MNSISSESLLLILRLPTNKNEGIKENTSYYMMIGNSVDNSSEKITSIHYAFCRSMLKSYHFYNACPFYHVRVLYSAIINKAPQSGNSE